MVNLLLPVPWWLLGLLLIAGIGLFVSGNRRQKTNLRNGGIGCIALMIVLLLVNHFVETDIEKASRQTVEVMKAVEAGDWQKMSDLMDPKCTLSTSLGNLFNNRDEVVKGARDAAERYKLKSVTKTGLEARQDQADITVDINVLTVQEATMDRPVNSSWEFNWLKSDQGWRLYRVQCLKIGDENTAQIKQLIGH